MNKIIICCPFYNENLVAGLNIHEASKWVDEIHITESNRSFKYTPHDFCFKYTQSSDKVFYHQLDAGKYYLKPRKRIPHIIVHPVSRWMRHYYKNTAWYNEGVSRNHALWNVDYSDNDILILSDVDEIIDSRYADEIVEQTKKEGIVTIKLYFTIFYFNLWCPDFGGPHLYSYRIFAIRGDVLRQRFHNDSDYIRKLGERGELANQVKCLEGIKGFHHSWLGDETFILNKFNSFAHVLDDGFTMLKDKKGKIDVDSLREKLTTGGSIFDNTTCIINNDIPFIPGVEALREISPQYFL